MPLNPLNTMNWSLPCGPYPSAGEAPADLLDPFTKQIHKPRFVNRPLPTNCVSCSRGSRGDVDARSGSGSGLAQQLAGPKKVSLVMGGSSFRDRTCTSERIQGLKLLLERIEAVGCVAPRRSLPLPSTTALRPILPTASQSCSYRQRPPPLTAVNRTSKGTNFLEEWYQVRRIRDPAGFNPERGLVREKAWDLMQCLEQVVFYRATNTPTIHRTIGSTGRADLHRIEGCVTKIVHD